MIGKVNQHNSELDNFNHFNSEKVLFYGILPQNNTTYVITCTYFFFTVPALRSYRFTTTEATIMKLNHNKKLNKLPSHHS